MDFKQLSARRGWSIERVLLMLSIATNVALTAQVHHLKLPAQPINAALKIGQTIPAVVARDQKNERVVVTYADVAVPTVLYVLRPGCSWCSRNLANFIELSRQSQGRYRVITVSLDPGDFTQYGGPEKVLIVDESTRRTLKLGATPQTLVVSPDGKVMHNWIGAYGDSAKEIQDVLGITLPGLIERDAATKASFD